ncbi:MAG: DUF3006 domain-containing protein [Symbiobacteriia bacterium]
MFWVIDRFEGEYAVLVGDDRAVAQLPKANLPAGVKEGDVLRLDLVLDEEETARRRARIAQETEDLWK